MSRKKGVNENAHVPRQPDGKFLPLDGTRSRKIGEFFADKRTKPAKAIEVYKQAWVDAAGGPQNVTPRQWIILDDLTFQLKVAIVGEHSLNQLYTWLKEDLDMIGTVSRVTTARNNIAKLRKEFWEDIHEKKTTYADLLED